MNLGIPSLPISFERNSDLSALSWRALDEQQLLDEIRARYETLIAKPRMDPVFMLIVAGLANASFCRLSGATGPPQASSLPLRSWVSRSSSA